MEQTVVLRFCWDSEAQKLFYTQNCLPIWMVQGDSIIGQSHVSPLGVDLANQKQDIQSWKNR